MVDLKELIGLLTEYCNQYQDLQGKCTLLCPYNRYDDDCPVSDVIEELEYELENVEKE